MRTKLLQNGWDTGISHTQHTFLGFISSVLSKINSSLKNQWAEIERSQQPMDRNVGANIDRHRQKYSSKQMASIKMEQVKGN